MHRRLVFPTPFHSVVKANADDGAPSLAVLVGNKADLTQDREVSFQEGQHLAKLWGSSFFETSAKTRQNIDEVLD